MKPFFWATFAVLSTLNLHHVMTMGTPSDPSNGWKSMAAPIADTPRVLQRLYNRLIASL
jgi:hypothetical protein